MATYALLFLASLLASYPSASSAAIVPAQAVPAPNLSGALPASLPNQDVHLRIRRKNGADDGPGDDPPASGKPFKKVEVEVEHGVTVTKTKVVNGVATKTVVGSGVAPVVTKTEIEVEVEHGVTVTKTKIVTVAGTNTPTKTPTPMATQKPAMSTAAGAKPSSSKKPEKAG